jgi:dihydroflavonol-4-reductase
VSEGGAAVLVTGGTGFVGSALVRRLADAGDSVHVLARASSRREHLAGVPLVWHEGDLLDRSAVGRAVGALADAARTRGCAAQVVHSAALISYRSSDRSRSHDVNVIGTEHVLEACRAHGVDRLCFVSSVVAVGGAPDARATVDEDAPFRDHRLGVAYVSTKRAAEELVLSANGRPEVVVVNPGAVFGPSPEPTNTTRFLLSVAGGPLPPPAPPGSLSVVGVDDVAEGIRLALARGRPGRRYLLSESSWRLRDLMALVQGELGGRRPWASVPAPLWRLVVAGARLVDRVRPLRVASPQALRLLGVHYRFDTRRAREELGWEPSPFPEVLRTTLTWMRTEGLLDR